MTAEGGRRGWVGALDATPQRASRNEKGSDFGLPCSAACRALAGWLVQEDIVSRLRLGASAVCSELESVDIFVMRRRLEIGHFSELL